MTAAIFAHPATGRTASHFKQPAVYRHGFAISPRVCVRVLPEFPVPIYQRAQGMPGARCTRSLVCDKKQTHERSHHGHTGTTRHSPRNGFTAYFALSPVTRLV